MLKLNFSHPSARFMRLVLVALIRIAAVLCCVCPNNGFNGQYRGNRYRLYWSSLAKREGHDHRFHWANDPYGH